MRKILHLFILAGALASCRTAAETIAAQDNDLRRVVGLTMEQFTAQTGLTPSDAYPTNEGKTFLVEGRTVTLIAEGSYGAPTVSNSSTCRILLSTVHLDGAIGASAWKITDLNWRGPCRNAY